MTNQSKPDRQDGDGECRFWDTDGCYCVCGAGCTCEPSSQPTRDAAEGAGEVRDLLKRIRDFPHNSTSTEQAMSQLAGTAIALLDAPKWATPQPAPDAMEALAFFMAFFENMPEGSALTLTDLTALDRARARLRLAAPVPPADGAGDLKELAHQLESMDWGDAPGPMRVLALKVCRAIHAIPPSATGAAKPVAWTVFSFVQTAFAQFKEHELKQIIETIAKILSIGAPPVRGDREKIRKLVLDVIRKYYRDAIGPTRMLLEDIAEEIDGAMSALPVQPDAGEREDELADLIEDHIDKNPGHDGRSIAQLVIRFGQPPQSSREG